VSGVHPNHVGVRVKAVLDAGMLRSTIEASDHSMLHLTIHNRMALLEKDELECYSLSLH
jgi:hypothetical protein